MSQLPCAFAVGETSEARFAFDADGIRSFATASGDMNPLHHDDELARDTRFGGLIACAGQPTSYMMGALATFLTARGDALGLEFGFKLWTAIRAGQHMTLTWTVGEVIPKPAKGVHILKLDAILADPAGAVAITAWCKALVYPPGSDALRDPARSSEITIRRRPLLEG